MTPESGTEAMLFVAHGLTEVLSRLARHPGHHLNADRLAACRDVLRSHLPWSEKDEHQARRTGLL
jgi:hypothetical protein